MTKSEKKANNAIPRQTLKICRGYLFVYSGAIINQLPIYSPLILHGVREASFFSLIIESVITYGKGIGSVTLDPIVSGDPRIHKKEYPVGYGVALKTYLCGDNALLGGGVIDRSE